MHDIDRTQMEFAGEAFEAEQFEWHGESSGEWGEVFSESMEMELAHELLEINSEAELNHFLGKVLKQASSAIGKVMSSPQVQAAGTALKGAATAALKAGANNLINAAGGKAGIQAAAGNLAGRGGSAAGQWLGSKVGGIFGQQAAQTLGSLGAKYGGQAGQSLGSALSGRLFDLAQSKLGLGEMEFMEAEEMEFAGAQQFVRMAGDVARRMLQARGNPAAAARNAALSAARQYIPGLLQLQGGGAAQHEYAGEYAGEYGEVAEGGNSGRWVRRGNKVILYGV